MAAEVLKHPNFEEFETDDFFEVALEEGYTKQGKEFISSSVPIFYWTYDIWR